MEIMYLVASIRPCVCQLVRTSVCQQRAIKNKINLFSDRPNLLFIIHLKPEMKSFFPPNAYADNFADAVNGLLIWNVKMKIKYDPYPTTNEKYNSNTLPEINKFQY